MKVFAFARMRHAAYSAFLAIGMSVAAMPSSAWAFVPHGYPGIYIHQMGHVFFFASCLVIGWVICRKGLHREHGWRFILVAQVFFALWNLDTFVGHISEYWIDPWQVLGSREGWDYFRRDVVIEGKEYLFYVTKFDHLWLVPGMVLFYLGLKEHLRRETTSTAASAVLPLFPIIFVDIAGSALMIVFSAMSLHAALRLYRLDRENTLWNYLLWLAAAYLVFSFSRSLGHILNRILVPAGYEAVWRAIEPYSGSLNTFTFIVIGAVSLFFFRAYVTYLKLAEDRVRIEAVNQDLAELNREIETLVTERTMSLMALTVADRIRNPATVIGGTCKRMLTKEPVSDAMCEKLKDVIDESDKLQSIVRDFEGLLKSRQSMFTREDVNELIKGVIAIVTADAGKKGVRLVANLPKYPVRFNMRRNLLKAAIFHVVKNAVEATPQGGTVVVSTSEEGDKAGVSVADTGPGIPEEDRERIFDPFFSTKPSRFGMGLPLVNQIVSEHLGEITVTGEPGGGTTFTMVFPVRWTEKKPSPDGSGDQ